MAEIVSMILSCFQVLGPLSYVIAAFFVVLLVMLALKVWIFILDLIPLA